MDHYVEVRLLPDPEFTESMLMNALFAKLHRALHAVGGGEVGVSFPRALEDGRPEAGRHPLGAVLRLHGSRAALERVMEQDWMAGMRDHASQFGIMPVPAACRHGIVRREQAKSSPERLYRRSARKGWMTSDEAQAKASLGRTERLDLPFLQMKSMSTGQQFKLFVRQGAFSESAREGSFSSYGLSSCATVPWF